MSARLAFSYDGFGLNDATDPYRPRVLTFAQKARSAETAAQHDRIGNLLASAPELLQALEDLRAQLRHHVKFDVRKHYSLMVADVAASKAIDKARGS